MDTFLVKAVNGDHYKAQFKFLEASYGEDVDTGALPGHATKYFGSYVMEKIACFDEILKAVSKFPKLEETLIQEAQPICKLPPVNPATSVAGERSFSSARHLKTWLLSRMGDLAVLHGHKRRTDSISITTQEFVFRNKNRKRSFGTSGNFKR